MKLQDINNYIFPLNFLMIIGLVWLFFYYPQYLAYFILFLIAFFVTQSIYFVHNSKIKDSWWNLVIFPSTLSIALFFSLTILSDVTFQRIITFLSAWLVATFWRKAYLFLHEPKKYRLGSLEYLSDYGNIFVILLLSISFYGFRDYLETSFLLLIFGLTFIVILVFYNFFWSNKFIFQDFWPYLLISVLIVAELSWAISLLPFTYINSAILLTVTYYALTHLQKLHLQAKLTNEKIRHYIVFFTVTFIIIFLSARWL
jgi:hypothetical protein